MKRYKVQKDLEAESKRQCAMVLLIEAQNRIKNAMAYLVSMRPEKKRQPE